MPGTTNHHTPVATTAPANAATINTPLASLDSAITALAAGTTGLTGLRLATATTLTISGGAVTKTGSQHTIDTEASASTDDLTTINGYATGDILIISAANTSRVVTVKHGTGNIYLYGKMDLVLDDTDKTIELIYRNGRWEQTNGLPTTAVSRPTSAPFRRPSNMPLMMTPAARNWWMVRAAAATIQAMGIAALTATATTTAVANQADSTYTSYATSNIANNAVTLVPSTYNIVRRAHNPKIAFLIQVADVISTRLWVGFTSAALTNVDTVAGATEFAGMRYSTAAGDSGLTPVTKDSSTQTTGTAINGMSMTALTPYLIEVELTSSAAIFTLNNGAPVSITTNLPATSTDLGFNIYYATLAGSIRTLYFSRVFCEFD